nr:MAG TPA: GTP-binding protein TrmE N-terminus [Caudoviricetes sp.]
MKVKKRRLRLKGGLVLETHLHGSTGAMTRAYFLNGKQLGKFEQIGVAKLAQKLCIPLDKLATHVGFDVRNPYTRTKLGL